ncbi:expressed protein [Cryptococcus deneoformans JEC21]|uniref:Expressed protein n=1 Tax=Cryptococcus deneoformans (strain JEC21 / ATCC MYA-565) TaxID=214684 RepID=Q5KPP9_CRYD1|nr:expressed protein [Cryptococcus neoformans var. neoformans JEC21]AAW41325.1 expressed protein [Cryptococcus neoformans var. neoformans JEC21]
MLSLEDHLRRERTVFRRLSSTMMMNDAAYSRRRKQIPSLSSLLAIFPQPLRILLVLFPFSPSLPIVYASLS